MSMTILVPVRQTVDHHIIVRPAPDGKSVDSEGAALIINPFDEIALEAALQLKERGLAGQVVVASIGPEQCEQALRTALAMGADTALRVASEQLPEPLVAARGLAALARRCEAEMVLMGKQAIDDDLGVTAQMLAAELGWPQAMFATAIEPENGQVRVECEHDTGLRVLKLPLPCVIAAELRLAQPRFVSLASVMKAKRKPIEQLSLTDVGLAEPLESCTEIVRVEEARRARAAEMLSGVDELIERLRARDLWPGGEE